MGEYNYILVSVYEDVEQQLLKIAVKARDDLLTKDVIKYFREPKNEIIIKNLLPNHCRGVIVDVEEIFWIE